MNLFIRKIERDRARERGTNFPVPHRVQLKHVIQNPLWVFIHYEYLLNENPARNDDVSCEMILTSVRESFRYNGARVIICSRDCTSTSYTSCWKRNKRNSPTAIPSAASTYAFPMNYRFIVRSFSLLRELALSRRCRTRVSDDRPARSRDFHHSSSRLRNYAVFNVRDAVAHIKSPMKINNCQSDLVFVCFRSATYRSAIK